jgi:four helix bundle protein
MEVRRGTLRDQLDRACESVVLALAEGLPHDSARMRRQYFARAKASLAEAADLGAAVGAIDQRAADAVIALASKVRAMTVGLLRVTE